LESVPSYSRRIVVNLESAEFQFPGQPNIQSSAKNKGRPGATTDLDDLNLSVVKNTWEILCDVSKTDEGGARG